jgi:hypothetical protein
MSVIREQACVIKGGWPAGFLCVVLSLQGSAPAQGDRPALAPPAGLAISTWNDFVSNRGQWHPDVRFAARSGGVTLWVHDDGATLGLEGRSADGRHGMDAIRILVEDADPKVLLEGRQEVASRHHFLFGGDPTGWRTDVPAFRSVVVRGVQSGVDVTWRRDAAHFAFDLTVTDRPQGGTILLRYEGPESVEVAVDGSIDMRTRLGVLHQSSPISWMEHPDGSRSAVTCLCRPEAGHRLAIEFPPIAPGARLVIDPGLEWSSYLGTNKPDEPADVAITSNGDLIVVGQTKSPAFPISPGAYDSAYGTNFWKGFVMRLRPADGSLVYSTYLGGTNDDHPIGVDVGDGDEAVVLGLTVSADFPTTPGALKTSQPGLQEGDGFVTRLTADGSGLVYSTLLGGSDNEFPTVMSLDPGGTVTIAGMTYSSDFPVSPNAYQTGKVGADTDLFITRLSENGSSIVCSTYLGGAFGETMFRGLGVAPDGSAVVSGQLGVDVLPTSTIGSGPVCSVVKLKPDFSAVDYITKIGGGLHPPIARCAALDAQGRATIAGQTISVTMPVTPGVVQPAKSGSADAFVLRLEPDGRSIEWCTYLGGILDDYAEAIHVDNSGVTTLGGWTISPNFPATPGAYKTVQDGLYSHLFAARLSPDASQLWYSTFVGGGAGSPMGMDVGPAGEVALTAKGDGDVYPTTPTAYDSSWNGLADAVVSQLSMLPAGVEKLGASTPGCSGPLAIGVTAMPQIGSADFGLTCNNIDPSAVGWLIIGASALSSPVGAKGANLWIDPLPYLVLLPMQADAVGGLQLSLPIPLVPSLAGVTAYAQFFWHTGCRSGQLSASNGLAITIQP